MFVVRRQLVVISMNNIQSKTRLETKKIILKYMEARRVLNNYTHHCRSESNISMLFLSLLSEPLTSSNTFAFTLMVILHFKMIILNNDRTGRLSSFICLDKTISNDVVIMCVYVCVIFGVIAAGKMILFVWLLSRLT